MAVVLDGKTFADATMVIALGITLSGEIRFLGFVETDTENAQVLTPFLRSLVERCLDVTQGVLVIFDGDKGLRSAVRNAFRDRALDHGQAAQLFRGAPYRDAGRPTPHATQHERSHLEIARHDDVGTTARASGAPGIGRGRSERELQPRRRQ